MSKQVTEWVSEYSMLFKSRFIFEYFLKTEGVFLLDILAPNITNALGLLPCVQRILFDTVNKLIAKSLIHA